ncbi:MAG: ArnT family glycosyltransferase [Tepidisphaeraceae bacterium]
MADNRLARNTLWVILALLVLRTVAQVYVPLMHQEAYYWMYWRHPSLSYFDHPPMVAWVIGLGTTLFGTNEWGVRVVGGLLMLVNGVLMYRFVRAWWSASVAWISVLFIELTPVFYGIGFLATMDSALLMFWLISLIGFTLAVKENKWWGWYISGFGLGGALLSKYTGVMLIPGVGLLLLFRREFRGQMKTIHPWLGVLLGIAMFWPVIKWNAQNDWASFRFQFLSRFDEDRTGHEHTTLEFLAEQVATATPLVLWGGVLICWAWIRRRRITARNAMALSFSLPLLASVAYKSLHYPIHINWTAPAFLALIPASVHLALVLARRKHISALWSWRGGAIVQTFAICTAINVGIMGFLLFLQPRTHWIHAFGPWGDLAEVVSQYEDMFESEIGHEPLVIADGKYELASLLAFYRTAQDGNPHDPDDPAKLTTSQYGIGDFGLGYQFWLDRQAWIGKDCLFVDMNDTIEKELPGKFRSVQVVWTGKTANGRTYRIAECRDLLN